MHVYKKSTICLCENINIPFRMVSERILVFNPFTLQTDLVSSKTMNGRAHCCILSVKRVNCQLRSFDIKLSCCPMSTLNILQRVYSYFTLDYVRPCGSCIQDVLVALTTRFILWNLMTKTSLKLWTDCKYDLLRNQSRTGTSVVDILCL